MGIVHPPESSSCTLLGVVLSGVLTPRNKYSARPPTEYRQFRDLRSRSDLFITLKYGVYIV